LSEWCVAGVALGVFLSESPLPDWDVR